MVRPRSNPWWIGLLLAGCGNAPQQSTPAEAPLVNRALRSLDDQAIVWYNVENLFDTIDDPRTNDDDYLPHGELRWTGARYQQKLSQLAKAIHWAADGQAPIVGLAEVENRSVLEDLVRTTPLSGGGYTVVHADSPDARGMDVALLVRKAYAEVLRQVSIPVQLPDGRATRDALYAELALADEERLHLFALHWPSRREGTEQSEPRRMAAAAAVRPMVHDILRKDPRALLLIMGDLNDGPEDASVQEGLGAVCSPNDGKLIALMCADGSDQRGSYNHQGTWTYLDQFIVSTALYERTASAQAYRNDRLMFRHPRFGPSPDRTYAGTTHKGGFSDHLPIVLRLEY